MRLKYFYIIFLFFSQSAFAVLPHLPKGHCDQLLEKTYYYTCYSKDHRQANWTYHALFYDSINGKQGRTDDFRADYKLNFRPKQAWDLKPTDFDRGHLVPAADMKINYLAMTETFLMSNIAPQEARFNRGIWARLERTLRDIVEANGDGYVVTGALFGYDTEKTVKGISVAKSFYKILYIPASAKMYAFLLPHESYSLGSNVWKYQTTVDHIEKISGIDFFEDMNSRLERKLEASLMKFNN